MTRSGHSTQRLAVGQGQMKATHDRGRVQVVMIGGSTGRQLVLDVNVAVHVTHTVHITQVIRSVHHLLVVLQTARGLCLQDHLFHGQG